MRAEQSRKLAKGVKQTIRRKGRENKQWEQQRKQPQVQKVGIADLNWTRLGGESRKDEDVVPTSQNLWAQTFQDAVGINNTTRVQAPQRETEKGMYKVEKDEKLWAHIAK